MNKRTDRQFTFAPAVRERVSLIVMLAGPSGSGKTLSALKIARGLAGGDDSKIGVIDTESGRALHYAPARGEKASDTKFGFMHLDISPPFSPEAYIDAILAADEAGFGVIVVDSASHEWDGEGGLQDIHDDLVAATVERARSDAAAKGWSFNEQAAAEKASIGAWREPKGRHRRFVSRLLQCRSHLILCFRADEKMRMEQVEEERNGKKFKKTVITPAKDLPPAERWAPICEKRMPYEMTISLVLAPDRPGVPIPIKLQAQHFDAVDQERPLSEATGRALAAWAAGGALADSATAQTPTAELRADEAERAAREGTAAFRAFWSTLPKSERSRLRARLPEFQKIATDADAEDDPFASSPDVPANGPATAAQAATGAGETVGKGTPAPNLLADLIATGDARAAAGIDALTEFLESLSPAESKLIDAKQRQAWLDVAGRVVGVAA